MSLRRYRIFLAVLAVMIVGLMALGAGVRTMNAGLSCPDWPLCFGKVIPDFHVGVWFEFVHRAYAGLVAILYAAALVMAFRLRGVPLSTKTAAKWGLGFLTAQIVMGGLTVLLLVKAVIVTSHLLLATLFFSCVIWMYFGVNAQLKPEATDTRAEPRDHVNDFEIPASSRRPWLMWFLPAVVFVQISIGGLVASTYSGSVCVDWPLCNGQWVPTWKGAIGLQIIHRMVAYGLVVMFLGLAGFAFKLRAQLPPGLVRLFYWCGAVVCLQTFVGILNLLYYIPPHITVPHQTLAVILLALTLKIVFETREAVAEPVQSIDRAKANRAESLATPF